jgi:glutamate-1-semialdehyde 2,1-aminomutase
MVTEAANAGLPLIVQGPPGVSSFHCRATPLEHPGEYDFELMSKDIIVATCLQRHGVLVSTVSRLYPNAQLADEDLEFFEVRARKALAEAKQSIDEIF